jgi:3',5'-cyclic AMP phosphodiesterase CpdA
MKQKIAVLLLFFAVFLVFGFGQETAFYFAMLADTQFGMHTADRNFIQETANYEFAVATVNRLKPAFVIILGDLVNKAGDADQINEFKRISKKIDSSIPVYLVAGNHDVENVSTPETLAAYRREFGRDYYSFRAGPIYGIVLNSTVIHSPQNVESEYREQISWLEEELKKAKASDARHIVVFQHHPYFVENAQEPNQFGNIPLERRNVMLSLLHKYGVRYVFAGHTHRNFIAKDGELEVTASGPVSLSFGEEGSGIRLALVTDGSIQHRYFNFSRLPNTLTVEAAGRVQIPKKPAATK